MSDSFAQFQRTFEIFANKQAAQIEALTCIVQVWMASMFASHPEGAKLFADLRKNVLDRLDSETKLAGGDQDAKRKAVFVHEEAVAIFDALAPVFDANSSGSSEQTH